MLFSRTKCAAQAKSKHLVFGSAGLMLNPDRNYYVYMMQSASRRALYIGVTSNLHQRVFNHKHHRTGGFTESYAAARLVYFEQYSDVRTAIDREKQLKGWRWEKKENLVAAMNSFAAGSQRGMVWNAKVPRLRCAALGMTSWLITQPEVRTWRVRPLPSFTIQPCE